MLADRNTFAYSREIRFGTQSKRIHKNCMRFDCVPKRIHLECVKAFLSASVQFVPTILIPTYSSAESSGHLWNYSVFLRKHNKNLRNNWIIPIGIYFKWFRNTYSNKLEIMFDTRLTVDVALHIETKREKDTQQDLTKMHKDQS